MGYVRCERKTEYWYIHLRLDVLQVRIRNSRYIILISLFPPDSSPFGQFIGSIIPLASDRFGERFFDCDQSGNVSASSGHLEAFRKVGVLTGVNQAMQCESLTYYGRWPTLANHLSGLGSILVGPLIQRYQTRMVLLGATVIFALLASILIIVDGKPPPSMKTTSPYDVSGHWWTTTTMGQLQPRGNLPVSCRFMALLKGTVSDITDSVYCISLVE